MREVTFTHVPELEVAATYNKGVLNFKAAFLPAILAPFHGAPESVHLKIQIPEQTRAIAAESLVEMTRMGLKLARCADKLRGELEEEGF